MDNDGVKGLSNLLSVVNPQDIESFSVLKDASATAIYGYVVLTVSSSLQPRRVARVRSLPFLTLVA